MSKPAEHPPTNRHFDTRNDFLIVDKHEKLLCQKAETNGSLNKFTINLTKDTSQCQ